MAARIRVVHGHLLHAVHTSKAPCSLKQEPPRVEISAAPHGLSEEHKFLFSPDAVKFLSELARTFQGDIDEVQTW